MGFDPVTLGIAQAVTVGAKAAEAYQQHEQSKAYRQAAAATEIEARRRAESIRETAMENERRERRNMQMQLARARTDAGASNLLREGTAVARELDLATRLTDEINNRTDAALEEANTTMRQGEMDAWNLRVQSRNAHNSMIGTMLGATGNLTGDLFGKQGIWPGGFSR